MQLTLKSVSPTVREWNSDKYPGACSVKVWFEEGHEGELATKVDKAQSHIEALKALIGKPGEFEITKDGEYQGTRQLQFKGYPGRAESKSFGGSKGNYVPAFHQTAEGEHFVQERTDRRCALMQAVAASVNLEHGDITLIADAYYDWLRATCPSVPQKEPVTQIPASTPKTAPIASVTSGNGTPVALAAEIWNGPDKLCPACHAPIGAKHNMKVAH